MLYAINTYTMMKSCTGEEGSGRGEEGSGREGEGNATGF